jgi:predicted nucleic acid-binding protein
MPEPPVSDSTPLIAFARIGRLDLLEQLFGTILVPPAVHQEIVPAGLAKKGTRALQRADWIKRHDRPDPDVLIQVDATLGRGEREAIALGKQLHRDLLIDERLGRTEAARLNVAVIGSVGALLHAKRQALIAEVKPFLDALSEEGFYLSDAFREEALHRAGEAEYNG